MTATSPTPDRHAGARRPGEDPLATSPFGSDVDAELAAAPRRGVSKVTVALGAGVIFMAGVIAGIQAHKAFGGDDAPGGGQVAAGGGPAQRPGAGGQAAQGQGGGFGRGQGPGGGFGGGGVAVGTVSRVDGDTIYLRTVQGTTVTVRTGEDTRIRVTKDGKVSDLEQGTTVIVRGTQADDGGVDATEVSQTTGRGGGPGFGGGFGGGPGGGRGGDGGRGGAG